MIFVFVFVGGGGTGAQALLGLTFSTMVLLCVCVWTPFGEKADSAFDDHIAAFGGTPGLLRGDPVFVSVFVRPPGGRRRSQAQVADQALVLGNRQLVCGMIIWLGTTRNG